MFISCETQQDDERDKYNRYIAFWKNIENRGMDLYSYSDIRENDLDGIIANAEKNGKGWIE